MTTVAPEILPLIRDWLNGLLTARGMSPTGLAKAMGKSHTWLLRKIDPGQSEARPLTSSDLSLIIRHLQLDWPALLADPQLAPELATLLRYLSDCPAGAVVTITPGGATPPV